MDWSGDSLHSGAVRESMGERNLKGVALASLIIYKAVIVDVVKGVPQHCRIRRLVRPQRTGWSISGRPNGAPAPVETPTVSVSNETCRRCFATNTARRPQHNPRGASVGFHDQQRLDKVSHLSPPLLCRRVHEPPSPKKAPSPRSTTWV